MPNKYCPHCGFDIASMAAVPPGGVIICISCLEPIHYTGLIWFEKLSWLTMPPQIRDSLSKQRAHFITNRKKNNEILT